MNEWWFRPLFCTAKAILRRGQHGLMRWILIWINGSGSIARPVDQQSSALPLHQDAPFTDRQETDGLMDTQIEKEIDKQMSPVRYHCATAASIRIYQIHAINYTDKISKSWWRQREQYVKQVFKLFVIYYLLTIVSYIIILLELKRILFIIIIITIIGCREGFVTCWLRGKRVNYQSFAHTIRSFHTKVTNCSSLTCLEQVNLLFPRRNCHPWYSGLRLSEHKEHLVNGRCFQPPDCMEKLEIHFKTWDTAMKWNEMNCASGHDSAL